jgi:hypothetical protein
MEIIELIKQPCLVHCWSISRSYRTSIINFRKQNFGISANLRHACAACLPANIQFFKYDWKKKFGICFYSWDSNRRCNCFSFLSNPNPIIINDDLRTELATYYKH